MEWVAKMARRGPADLLLASEALVLLTIFRTALALAPVRRILGRLNPAAGVNAAASGVTTHQMHTAGRVQWAVNAVARHSPVEFVCFPQALAGYWMLRRRGVPATLVYGVA